jgi:hypothetical protein
MKRTVMFVATTFFCLTPVGCWSKGLPSGHASLAGKTGVHAWDSPLIANKLWGLDRGFVQYQQMDGGLLLLWSDAVAGGWRSSTVSGVTKGDGSCLYQSASYPKGLASYREVKVTYTSSDESHSGQVTIDDKHYDLANGSLFLVSGIGGGLRVKQLSRDLSKLRQPLANPTFDEKILISFGKNDPDIKTFFAPTTNHN